MDGVRSPKQLDLRSNPFAELGDAVRMGMEAPERPLATAAYTASGKLLRKFKKKWIRPSLLLRDPTVNHKAYPFIPR